MQGESLFTGVRTVDYRNARYQGMVHSVTGKRQGVGILIDDDLNFYCSEWEEGRLSGSTFIFLNNGNYLYGAWRSNEPNGIAVYRNREFLTLGNYHRGANVGNTLAISDSINHLLVFSGEEVQNKEKKKEVEVLSSEAILEISLFQDIVYHTAAKHGLQLGKKDASIVGFLRAITEKYSQNMQLIHRAGVYYFGFQGGAAIRFALGGRASHRIAVLSMGWHDDDRITDFGAKFHETRCIEQGNFSLKETITYNKSSERPREKCHSIFQKNHKKGLNFVNEYFEYRPSFLANLEWFLTSRLLPKHQENLKLEYDMRRLQGGQGKQGGMVKVQSKEELKRPVVSKNRAGDSRTPTKSMTKNCSNPYLHKKDTGHSPIPRKYKEEREESMEFDEYQEIQDELSHFKKETICQRCRSKEKKRSQNKVTNPNQKPKKSQEKSISKSKSSQKLGRPGGVKEIKYLVNYRPQQKERSASPIQKASHSKSISNLPHDKEKVRMENELKIRQQIYQQQQKRQARHQHAINYPLTFSEFLAPHATHEQSLNIHSFSPSSRSREALLAKPYPYKYQYQYSQGRNNENLGLLAGVNSIKKIEELENRRDRILREFKELNTPVPYQGLDKIAVNPYLRSSPSHRPAPSPALDLPRQKDSSRQRVEQFNRRYRNYLQSSQKSPQTPLPTYDEPSFPSQPYVASFIHSPPPPRATPSKKYEYFFDK